MSFSLKELAKLEDERVDQEKRGREMRAEAARLARESEEKRARDEQVAQLRAEEDTRERRRREEREEEARLEALQRATVEQTRITVEARTRAEEAERERSHERELQRMRLEGARSPERGALIGSGLGGIALALAVFMGFFFGVAKPASDRRIAELEGTAAAAQDRAVALDRKVEEQARAITSVTKERDEARARLAAAPTATVAAPPPKPSVTGKGGTGGTGKGPTPKDDPPCDPHDPMCFHLP